MMPVLREERSQGVVRLPEGASEKALAEVAKVMDRATEDNADRAKNSYRAL